MIEILRNQAKEIADAGINGWGNTMIEAADTIESMRQQLSNRDAEIAELVAALDNSIFVFDLDPKIAKALAKVRKP